jgi:hypothetical protein
MRINETVNDRVLAGVQSARARDGCDRALQVIRRANVDDFAGTRCDRAIGDDWRDALIRPASWCGSGARNELSNVVDEQVCGDHRLESLILSL